MPCPAPRADFADVEVMEDGRRRRRRRRKDDSDGVGDGTYDELQLRKSSLRDMTTEEELLNRKAHECPVPKPKVVVGRVFGFK